MSKKLSQDTRVIRIIIKLARLNANARQSTEVVRLRRQASRLWNWLDVAPLGATSYVYWHLMRMNIPKAYIGPGPNDLAFEYFTINDAHPLRYLGGCKE